jgi:Lrp/AsnC family transcriptional regulator, leucine-responsive regulatory protein
MGEKLMALDGVEQVYYTMGDADFIIISRVQTRDQLNDLIARIITIDRINETSSKFVMQEFENDHAVTSNRTDEARAAILDWSVANETTPGQPNCPDSRCVSDPRGEIS